MARAVAEVPRAPFEWKIQSAKEYLIEACHQGDFVGSGMVKIKVDYSKCVEDHDEICLEICPENVFVKKGSSKPKVARPEDCTLCRSCQFNCPGQAIEIIP